MQQSTKEETVSLFDEEELEFLSDIAEQEENDSPPGPQRDDSEAVQEHGTRKGLRRVITRASATERGMMAVCLALIVLVIVLGVVLVRGYTTQKARSAFRGIGEELEGVGVLGAEGLQTVERLLQKDAQAQEDQRFEELKQKEKEAALEEAERVTVMISLQNVVSDLKIKFLDQATGKIIREVPFAAKVTDANGKEQIVTDEDRDGIIHLTGIAPGNYDVTWSEIAEAGFLKYAYDNIVRRATVSDRPAYTKVDVSDEVVNPAEMPADSVVRGMQGTTVEAREENTQELLDSAKVLLSGGEQYVEIPRTEIRDPDAQARLDTPRGGFRFERLRHRTEEDTPADTGAGTQTDASAGTAASGATGTGDTAGSGASDTATTDTQPAAESTSAVTYDAGGTQDSSTGATGTEEEVPPPPPEEPDNTDTGTTQTEQEETAPGVPPETPLLTNDGQPVFVKNASGIYVQATAADYRNQDTVFYRRVSNEEAVYQYTGWQTIGGRLYYYGADHRPVTGEQTIGGVRYTFREDGSLVQTVTDKGIDVSVWNGNIDWNAVRGAGISYAIIRLGYRGSVTSRLTNDANYHTNMKGATAAGLKVGVYFVTQAVNETEAVEEASYCLSLISSYPLSLPVFLDVEASGGRGDAIDMKTRTAVCKAFCRTIENGGYSAGIYANKNWMINHIDMTQLTDYTIWMAQYATQPTYNRTRIDLWQHSCEGKVPGISGAVDLNISYLNW